MDGTPHDRAGRSRRTERAGVARLAAASLAAALLLTAGMAQAPTDSNVRGIFLESRPGKAAKAAATAPKAGAAPAASARLALGYTLFLDAPEGAKRVKPERVFRNGDKLRLLVEVNRDAYLYVLHQEDEGATTLLFPDARIGNGENRVAAHELCEVPAGAWFVFDEKPGQEKLTLLVSEKPLESIPRGEQLALRPGFQLSPAEVARLVSGGQKAESGAARDEGRPISPAEGRRGLTLSASDPAPSRVLMKTGAQSGWITTQLVLTHK